jgi:uncharacterized protein (TIGR02001 family)
MKKPLALLAATATAAIGLLPSLAVAQEPAFTGNITLASDYRFRGLSQTFRLPALQGGFDWTSPAGFYVGNWNSNVSGVQYPHGAGLEMDFYGGYKFEVAKGVTVDVGGLYYYYPGAHYDSLAGSKYDNFDVYAGVALGDFSLKAFYGVTDFFGLDATTGTNGGSKGSTYVEANYATEIAPKLTLGLHVGRQSVRNYGALGYTDYKAGLTYDWGGWLLGAAVVGTNADKASYTVTNAAGKSRNIGESGLVLSVAKTF